MATTFEPTSPERNRPRPRSRMMSWGNGGNRSEEPQVRPDTSESSREKARNRMSLHTKADPNRAMGESEPVEVQLQASTMDSLRSMSHKDAYGNAITDPDQSNPTRPRLERPLDTIRSFEAAAEGRSGRQYPPRPETAEPSGFASRRSSYHQAYGPMANRYQDDAYGSRSYGGHSAMGQYGAGARSPAPLRDHRRMPPRGHPDAAMYNENAHGADYYQNGPNHHYAQYDTATTGSGISHGTEPWSNATDPSSLNSSYDRLQQYPPPPPKNDGYGTNGYGSGGPELQQRTIMEEQGYDRRDGNGAPRGGYGDTRGPSGGSPGGYSPGGYGAREYGNGGDMAPVPPTHAGQPNLPRNPSKLQSARRTNPTSPPGQQYDGYGAPVIAEGGEKRKSWLKRRFSKNGG